MPQTALILDFGNVVAFFDFEKATAKLGPRLGLSGRELLEQLRSAGFNQLHTEFERGKMSGEDFSQQVAELISLTITHEEFALAWGDIFTANESIIPVIENFRSQAYRLVLGSNTNDIHAARFREQFATTLAHFDRLVLSYEVGEMKPHRDFYLACAQAAASKPQDCLFIDDLEENIEGARAAGLRGIVYRSTNQLIDDLSKLGINMK